MEKKITDKGLVNASAEKCFWVHNGPILKNSKELLDALKKMKRPTFTHHVNKGKNDFSKWIKEVLGDNQLAEALEKARTKQEFIKNIRKKLAS